MSTERTASAAIIGRVWSNGQMADHDERPDDVWQAFESGPDARAWLLLPRKDTEVLRRAAHRLDIDDLAIEDLVTTREPVKLDWLGRSMVAVLRAVTYDAQTNDLEVHSVSLLAGHRALLVLVDDAIKDELHEVLLRSESGILAEGVPGAIHAVVDRLVDGYADVIDALEEAVGSLSERLFDDRPLRRDQQLTAFRIQQSLTRLRRSTQPMRDVAARLANAAGRSAPGGAGRPQAHRDPAEALLGTRSVREFCDVADHAEHVAQRAESLREEMTALYETNLALADVHLNTVMKKLSGWAAIIAVPTLITGFMGMNVPYPGYGTKAGFVVALVVIVVAMVVLYVMLRRKDWI